MTRSGEAFVGGANYAWAVNDGQFRQSIFNNFLWLLVVPAACTFLGLIIAVLTDRIWWGNIAKSLIFLPLAISFVGASVIWKFVYDYRGEGQEQIGILNAIVSWLRRRAAGVDRHAVLEQLLPHGDPDLDPDRLCHGHLSARAARRAGRHARGGRHRRRRSLQDLLAHHGAADHVAPSSWCGPPSPSWCSRSSTSCSP